MPHRENHLAYANACNELVAGGAHKDTKTDAVTGGLMMFKAISADTVENFAKNDPLQRSWIVQAEPSSLTADTKLSANRGWVTANMM